MGCRMKGPKIMYLFSVCLMLLLLSLGKDQSAFGARKGRKTTRRNFSEHALAKYTDSSCPASGKTADAISSLKEFHAELGRKINELSDEVTNAMEEQNRCVQERDQEREKLEENLKRNLTLAIEDQKRCLHERETKIERQPPTTTAAPGSIPACDDTKCKELSSKMLDMINHSADPCEDFYEYACGGVESDVHLSPADVTRDVNKRLRNKIQDVEENNPVMGSARTFHDACSEWRHLPAGNESVFAFARQVAREAGWFQPEGEHSPVWNMSHVPPATNLTHLLATFMKSHFTPFFDISVEPDASNSKHFLPRISLLLHKSAGIDTLTCVSDFTTKVAPPFESLSDVDLDEEYQKYRACMKSKGLKRKLQRMVDSVTAMNLMDHFSDVGERDDLLQSTKMATELLLGDIYDILPLEAEIKLTYLHKDYQTNSLKDIGAILGKEINWEEFFFILTGKHLSAEQPVLVYHQKELAEMITILTNEWKYSPAATHNSLLMLWSERVYSQLVSPLAITDDYCLQATKTLLPDVASALYTHSFPDAQLAGLQRATNSKVKLLKTNFKSLIAGSDPAEVARIREKIEAADVNVGAIADQVSLEESTKGIKLRSNHGYNVDFLLKRHRTLLYELLDQRTDSPTAMWINGIVPFEKEGFLVHETNSIYIPVGVLAPPYMYYRKRLPDYIFYGGLGHLVAEQLVRLIDGTGLRFTGLAKDWLPIASTPLIGASECLSDQLNSGFSIKGLQVHYRMPTPNLKLNNLISNSGATRLAWMSYFLSRHESSELHTSYTESKEDPLIWLGKNPLPPIQAYFLRIAQAQCSPSNHINLLDIMESATLIPRQKINLIMKNEPLFAKAFRCPSSAQMSPRIQCPFLNQPSV